jgi:hypothetical protein
MGLNMTRLARPFRANEIIKTLHPGLRCASPWAVEVRRVAATLARPFRAKGMIETVYPGLRCAPPWAVMARRVAAETTFAPCSMAIKSCPP